MIACDFSYLSLNKDLLTNYTHEYDTVRCVFLLRQFPLTRDAPLYVIQQFWRDAAETMTPESIKGTCVHAFRQDTCCYHLLTIKLILLQHLISYVRKNGT